MGPGRFGPLPAVAAIVVAVALAGCGSDRERDETGGLASTTSTGDELPPPPSGPLDEFSVDRIGELELVAEQGSGQVRQSGAEDARDLTYEGPSGPGAVVSLGFWPTPERARAYARKAAQVLDRDQGFERRGRQRPFDGREGNGILIRLGDGEGTEAGLWTTGRLSAYALAGRSALDTVISRAPYGGGNG